MHNAYESMREHGYAAGATAEEGTLRVTQALHLLPPSPRLRQCPPTMSRHTQMRTLGSLVLVSLTWQRLDFRSRLSRLWVDFHLRVAKNSVYPSTRRKPNNFF